MCVLVIVNVLNASIGYQLYVTYQTTSISASFYMFILEDNSIIDYRRKLDLQKSHSRLQKKKTESQEIIQFNGDPNEGGCLISLFRKLNNTSYLNSSLRVLFYISIMILSFFFFSEHYPYSLPRLKNESKVNILINVMNAEYYTKIIYRLYINSHYLYYMYFKYRGYYLIS